MPHTEFLELSGRWVRAQISMRILSVVWVGGIFGCQWSIAGMVVETMY